MKRDIKPYKALLAPVIFAILFVLLLSSAGLCAEVYGKMVRVVNENGAAEFMGTVDFFDNGKKIASEKFEDAKGYVTVAGSIPDGAHGIYDGEVKPFDLTYIVEYKDNKRNGLAKTFDNWNGGIVTLEALYKDGLANGMAREFYKSGGLKKEYTMKNGSIAGSYRSYYQSGALLQDAMLKPDNGGSSGTIKSYYEDGALLSDEIIKNDAVKELKAYYENGKLMQKNSDLFGFKIQTFYSMTGRAFGPIKQPFKQIITGENYNNVYSQGIAGNGKYYVADGVNKNESGLTLDVYDLEDFKVVTSTPVAGAEAFAVAPQSDLVAISLPKINGRGSVGFYDINGMVKRNEFVFDRGASCSGIYFEPKGRWLVCDITDAKGMPGYFILETGPVVKFKKINISGLRSGKVSFSENGKVAAFISSENNRSCVKIIDLESLREITTVYSDKNRSIREIALSPDGGRILLSAPGDESGILAGINDNNNLIITDIKNGSKVVLAGDKNGATGLAWYSDCRHVITGSFAMSVWDAATGSLEAVFSGHKGWLGSFSFTNEGKYVISAGQDSTVKVWENPIR